MTHYPVPTTIASRNIFRDNPYGAIIFSKLKEPVNAGSTRGALCQHVDSRSKAYCCNNHRLV
ncbi:MAG TPA: hypothetical protein VIV66_14605, partial [Pyrinomonadaceae bacterium]